jgi:hypothetical protein
MNLYAIVKKIYDETGKIISSEILDSGNDLGILINGAKDKLVEESNSPEFRGFSIPAEGFEGLFVSQDTLRIVYTNGFFRGYSVIDVDSAEKITFSYEDQFAEVVGSNLVDHSVIFAEIKAANIATYYLKNKYTNVLHEMSGMEEIKCGICYTTLCGSSGTHFEVVYKDSSNELGCQVCIDEKGDS